MSLYNKILAIFVSISLAACADTLGDRQSVAIDVVPLKHSYSVEIKKLDEALSEVTEYIESNWDTLAQAEIELVMLTDSGSKIEKHVRKLLRKKGKDPLQVTSVNGLEDSDFDFRLISTDYRVFTPICDYYQIGKIGDTATGCFVEGARWQSMTNPNKMVK
ncbi:hypothetical protein [Vibrio sp. qd031]|uniref:hypothetical protein n=1 Tax=Vibrio sp. qd031 TaxID=1603038 RepID=UPI000A11719B|nr:hypothetical protein [Vibrio sp. qd031]